MRNVIRLALLGAVILNAACAKKGDAPSDSAARVVTLPNDSAGTGGGGGGARCPMHGLWQQCSVEERLIRAGMVLLRGDSAARHDYLHVPGLVYRTGVSEVQVFIYPTQADRERDTATLDTVTAAPPGVQVVWSAPPTLVTSINLAAIVLSQNGRQSERIADALGAGLPPDPPAK